MKTAIELITEERERQITQEGWTLEHDDEQHAPGELACAAATYAMPPDSMIRDSSVYSPSEVPGTWPWAKEWWKPSPDNRIKELVKAGALIVAEIEKLQRQIIN